MAEMLLTIQHKNKLFTPPILDDVKVEWERTESPGKLTFKTQKVSEDMAFLEGDAVCFYYDNKPVFMGYVFKKKRDKKNQIEVTCYDQIRYLKNKFSYVFEKKTASQIVQALCKDFNLYVGDITDTKYTIPSIVKEDTSAMDIMLSALDETIENTGEMYVLYDDFGKITLKNCSEMKSDVLISPITAENFDYSSSIDDETYNSIVLYYKPQNNSSGTATSSAASGGVSAILNLARTQIGTAESPMGSNNVKYNTAYYGGAVSGSAYPWCCAFIWWLFRECGMSNLFYGGAKTAYCPSAVNWFKGQGRWHTSGYQPGDIVFFSWNNNGVADHVGIVESVNSDGSLVTIEGNTSDAVMRRTRYSNIMGVGRPNYATVQQEEQEAQSKSDNPDAYQVFAAQDADKIKQWGLLRYVEEIKEPSVGNVKAKQLLKLYARKTRELKVTGAFGNPTIRGGSLVPVALDLGDIIAKNYMLVEKVEHHFKKDQYTMDLTLEGAWDSE